ncbi:MAG: SDR family oxidoreductase [Candidatus Aminicenantes bacterium]|nr:SDR family oxidoreductase [Candidatus Aminicenantes bacterium]
MAYKPMQDKIALVTGGGSGIGRAISIKLSDAGAEIIIFARNEERGRDVVAHIENGGGNACFYRTDLTREKDIEQSVKQVIAKYGRVDILVNNAAISGYMGPVVDTPMEEVYDIFKINLISVFYLSKLVLPRMIENGFGRIINISSIAYRKNTPNSATYNITKTGLNSLTKTLSKEVASFGITVNAIAPGLVLTERIIKSRLPGLAEKKGITPEEMMAELTAGTDTKKLTEEEDVAELVMFLAANVSGNITGEIVNISGGL